MLLKEKVLETVGNLNSEFTMDELFEKICLIEEVEKGLEDIKNGRTISNEQLESEILQW